MPILLLVCEHVIIAKKKLAMPNFNVAYLNTKAFIVKTEAKNRWKLGQDHFLQTLVNKIPLMVPVNTCPNMSKWGNNNVCIISKKIVLFLLLLKTHYSDSPKKPSFISKQQLWKLSPKNNFFLPQMSLPIQPNKPRSRLLELHLELYFCFQIISE